jgi:hypothetical protein
MIQVAFKIPKDIWITELIAYERKMNAWCRENCAGNWFRAPTTVGIYEFEHEHDATMFALRWS